jgi:hypothetical protein
LNKTTAAPLSSLEITGAGFEVNADIQVCFFNKSGYSINVSASDVTQQSLKVSVPAYINPVTEEFSAGVVGVKIIQTSGTESLTTNTLEGLQIGNLPMASGSTGAVTIEYLDGVIQLLRDSQYHLDCLNEITDEEITDTVLADCLTTLEADYLEIKTQVQSVIDGTNSTVEIATITMPTGDVIVMNLDTETIDSLDRLLSAYNERLDGTLNGLAALTPLLPRAALAGSKQNDYSDIEKQADEASADQRWRIQNESAANAQEKVKTAGNISALITSLADPRVASNGQSAGGTRTASGDRAAAFWLSATFGTGATAMAQDYSAASAASGSGTWKQGSGFITGLFTNIINWLVTGETKVESKNKPFRDIVTDAFKTNSNGILIRQSSLANVTRDEAVQRNRLPQESGLNLVYYHEKPAVPESLAGLWTGTGWNYDCCEDDGTRLSRVTWDVSVFISSQNGTYVWGKITMKLVKQEIIDYTYWKKVYSFGPDHLMDSRTAEQYFYFHTPGWAWSWEIAPDRMTMDGYFEGPGPGVWCEGRTFHLAKYR